MDINFADVEGRTALYHASALLQTEMVQMLIDRDGVILDSLNDWSETPLMKCCRAGPHSNLIGEKLLVKGADANITDSKHRRTALHIAASLNNLEMIRLLCYHRANIEATDDMVIIIF